MRFAPVISSDNIEVFNKTKSKSRINILSVVVCFLLIHVDVSSQQDTAQQKPVDSLKASHDSAVSKFFSTIKKFGAKEQRKNIAEYNEGIIARKQDELIEEIRTLTLEAKSYLENGIDTTGLSTELAKIERWRQVTSDGVFINAGTIQTRPNLETSYKILRDLLKKTLARKSSLDKYYVNLAEFKNKIDSLYKDSVLYTFSSDSAVLMRYVKKLI